MGMIKKKCVSEGQLVVVENFPGSVYARGGRGKHRTTNLHCLNIVVPSLSPNFVMSSTAATGSAV